MNRILTPLALAAMTSAALLCGCHKDHDPNQTTTHSNTTSTMRSSGTSGYGADDKDATGAANKDAASDKDASGKDATADKEASSDKDAASSDKDATAAAQKERAAGGAHANIQPSKAPGQDDVKGVVRFTPAGSGGGVKVHAEITGLEPNSKHGFHIHEKADLSDPELKSAGGHFNPGMHKHGGPHTGEHHAGDLGNIEADDQGKATYDATVQGITLDDAKTGIIGKSVIVHGKADDLKTDPAGDSGPRIAGGVIERGAGQGQGSQGQGSQGQGQEPRGQQRGELPRDQQKGQQ